jgi:hypothetical protein
MLKLFHLLSKIPLTTYKKMAALNILPSNTTLVTMDVTSLYTNIPHSDGIEACKEIWEFVRFKCRLPTALLQC